MAVKMLYIDPRNIASKAWAAASPAASHANSGIQRGAKLLVFLLFTNPVHLWYWAAQELRAIARLKWGISIMTVGELSQALMHASHILAGKGILDAFGHVSCRHPVRPDHFLISRSLAPAMVTVDDIVEVDFDGTAIKPADARLFLERFIHAEIYRRNPEVHAIVHSHAPGVVPFTVVPSAQVRPICHMCGFLEGVPSPFDVADFAGDASDLLIRDSRLGSALAEHLGDASVVLMRGHGFTVVATSVAQATYRAFYTLRNCELQLAAHSLGEARFLTSGEAAACDATSNGQIDRAWNLWVSELQP